MPAIVDLSIAVTPETAAELQAAIEDGSYGSVSDVISEALHDWHLRRRVHVLETERLRRLVQDGINSGAGVDASSAFARLHARLATPTEP